MVAWLCTDEAANVNGRTFFVRAGFVGLYSEPEIIAFEARPAETKSLAESPRSAVA
jgi:hypothetical protein